MPVSQKRIELILVAALIIVATFFRFWQIKDYVVFLGDEGRDMIIMRSIFVDKNLPFLGPTASVGGFYLGPIYYWMAAPFLLLWRFDPVGPAYMVAFFGVATVFLLYKFTKEIAGFWPAILTASLYAVAPLIVRYSRSSWNPNPLPFFSLLMIYSLYRGVKSEKSLYFIGAGACLGIAVQLHYLAVILAPLAFLIVLASGQFHKLSKIALFSTLGFLITFSPFLTFEAKHNFPNFWTILEFTTRGSTVGLNTSNLNWSVPDIGNIFLEYISSYVNLIYTKITFWVITLGTGIGLVINRKNMEKRFVYLLAIIYFIGGLIILRSYKGQIYDYYFGSIFPAPFLALGLVIGLLWKSMNTRLLTVAAITVLIYFFLAHGFYTSKPNMLIRQTESVADLIIEKSNNQPYNFALISDSNSDHAYRYFLEIKNKKPTPLEQEITEQLIIICESACSPLGHPLWEVAAFGRAEISDELVIPQYNFTLYRLVHWPGEPSPAGKPAIKG